jgi:D-arabinose 1-dehydrogenase-like Zn-dependent alcohol dehydrogenase
MTITTTSKASATTRDKIQLDMSFVELSEVLFLAKTGKIRTTVKRIGFSEMNKTFEELAAGKIEDTVQEIR